LSRIAATGEQIPIDDTSKSITGIVQGTYRDPLNLCIDRVAVYVVIEKESRELILKTVLEVTV
jgi:hypothetical protein